MKINCIAIDDEPLALDIISAYCSKIPFLNLVKTFGNPINTLEFLRENPVDLIFLDIQMEGLTGIQLLKALKMRPHVILTTAYDNFAIEGFDLDVTDYLLKPISFERFIQGVNKVYERVAKERGVISNVQFQATPAVEPGPEYFFVKTETRIEKVFASEILYVQGMGDYWRICSRNPVSAEFTNRGLSHLRKLIMWKENISGLETSTFRSAKPIRNTSSN